MKQVGMKRGHLSCSAIACEITSADEAEYSGTFRPALERDGTRPCARVRILPFHPRCRHRSSPRAAKGFAGRIFPFGKIRLCSHLYPATTSQMLADDGYYPLPCSPPQLRRCWRGEFGLSSPDVTSGATAQCKTTNIILCQT